MNFAGLPTRGDVETIRQNVSGGIAKVSAGISKCAKRVSDAFKDSCFAKKNEDEGEEDFGSEEDFENIFDDEPEEGSEAL